MAKVYIVTRYCSFDKSTNNIERIFMTRIEAESYKAKTDQQRRESFLAHCSPEARKHVEWSIDTAQIVDMETGDL